VDQQGGLRVRRELEWQLPRLSPDVELVIYRVAQEALTNALRHAGAREATVSLRLAGDAIVLAVCDDGRGLVERTGEGGLRREGGLRGMRERAMMIDAQLEIRSRSAGGTEIALTVPLSSADPW
jgi:two-component system sensor histidine kinase UhpB